MTSKERSELKAKAQTADTIIIIGKGGLTDEIVKSAESAIAVRELIKGKTLETCPVATETTAAQIAEKIGAEVVQVIGSKFVLFRENTEKKVKKPAKNHRLNRKKFTLKRKN